MRITILFIINTIASFSSAQTREIIFHMHDKLGAPVSRIQVACGYRGIGETDEHGMVALGDVNKGDTLIFAPNLGEQNYLQYHFIVTEKSFSKQQEILMVKVDRFAEFPGGAEALTQWIAANVEYSQNVQKIDLYRTCWLRFIVHPDGKITDVKVITPNTACPECDAEAIRLVQAMPNWIPATVDGKAVSSFYDFPFHLRH